MCRLSILSQLTFPAYTLGLPRPAPLDPVKGYLTITHCLRAGLIGDSLLHIFASFNISQEVHGYLPADQDAERLPLYFPWPEMMFSEPELCPDQP